MIFHFGDCVLDTQHRELRCGGTLRPVEPQVFDLLQFLIQNRDRVVSRDDIFQSIWRGRFVSESVLSTRLNAARCAIGDNGSEQRLIRTLRRKGIRFVGDVREEKTVSETPPPFAAAGRRFTSVVKDAPAVVVLPFVNIGGDAKGEHFADGLTEEIITALSKLGWLFVISRHSSFAYKGRSPHLKEIAPKFGVQYALQGSVRRLGSNTRITLQLVDAANDLHLWAERFDRDLADTFGIQDEIANKAASIIGHQIFAAEDARTKFKSPDSLGAWECIVKALSLMNTRKKQHVVAARALLRQAIAIDPKSSPAYSLLSVTSTLGVHLGWHSRKDVLPIAFHTAQKAIALNSDESWGHVALGYATLQICNQPEGAIEHLEYAQQLNPNLAIAHYFIALASAYGGDCDNAFRHADMAEGLSLCDLLARGNSGACDNVRATTCFVAGRFHEGIKFARKAIIQSPMLVPAYRQVVTNCAFAGEVEEAKVALQTVRRFAPNVQRWLNESLAIWSHSDDFKKYVEAFRMAGLR